MVQIETLFVTDKILIAFLMLFNIEKTLFVRAISLTNKWSYNDNVDSYILDIILLSSREQKQMVQTHNGCNKHFH